MELRGMMSARDWPIGQKVRFVREYDMHLPPEIFDWPCVAAGTEGVIVRRFPDSLRVKVAGADEEVTVWFDDAYPDEGGKVDILEPI
jgi:hypothetical protein